MRALLLVAFLFFASPAYADGISAGSNVGRVFDLSSLTWTLGASPFVTVEHRGVSITSTTTYDREGILSHALSFWWRRDFSSWALSGGYDTYTFRGLEARDHMWTVRAETAIWKW